MLDLLDSGRPLESSLMASILAESGCPLPAPEDYASLRFGFLANDAEARFAVAELAQAIDLLVERPALERAIAEATGRFETELTDETFAEQQRLLQRKLEFDARLRQMASARSAEPSGTAT